MNRAGVKRGWVGTTWVKVRRLSTRTLLSLAAGSVLVDVSAAPPGRIVTCVDSSGHKIATNLPSVDCSGAAASLADAERAEVDSCERQVRADADAWKRKQRRERALLEKFPDEAALARRRADDVKVVRALMQQSDRRLDALAAERKPLIAEAEFYVGKPMPAKLTSALDANDAAVAAQLLVRVSQADSLARIDADYDGRLMDLELLWSPRPATPPAPVDCVAKVIGQRPKGR